jgi:hypothetical protein
MSALRVAASTRAWEPFIDWTSFTIIRGRRMEQLSNKLGSSMGDSWERDSEILLG